MGNKELIALLQEQDPEAEVIIQTSDGKYHHEVIDVSINKYKIKERYG